MRIALFRDEGNRVTFNLRAECREGLRLPTEGAIVRRISCIKIAFVVLAIITLTQAPVGQAHAQFVSRSIVEQCQKCGEENEQLLSEAGRNVVKHGIIVSAHCLMAGEAAPVCIGAMVYLTAVVEGLDALTQIKACSVCIQVKAALQKTIRTNCEIPTGSGSNTVRTLTVCRNGFGTPIANSCNAPHAGTPSTSSACKNLHCPPANTGC